MFVLSYCNVKISRLESPFVEVLAPVESLKHRKLATIITFTILDEVYQQSDLTIHNVSRLISDIFNKIDSELQRLMEST